MNSLISTIPKSFKVTVAIETESVVKERKNVPSQDFPTRREDDICCCPAWRPVSQPEMS